MGRHDLHLVCYSIPAWYSVIHLLNGSASCPLNLPVLTVGIPFSALHLRLMSWLCFLRAHHEPVQTPNSHGFSLTRQSSQGQDESSGWPPGLCWWLKKMTQDWHLVHVKCSVEAAFLHTAMVVSDVVLPIWSNVKGLAHPSFIRYGVSTRMLTAVLDF